MIFLIGASAGGDFVISPWLLIYEHTRNNGSTWELLCGRRITITFDDSFHLRRYIQKKILMLSMNIKKNNFYSYGLLSYMNNVVTTSNVVDVVRDTRGQIMPGACEFAE